MGTSQSSKGPSSNVPLVPSWVPGSDGDGDASGQESDAPAPRVAPDPVDSLLRPARGFAGVRTNLGSFARTGDSDHMRRGLGHYVRTSYGGATNATRRHGGTIRTAGGLYNVLASPQPGTQEDRLDRPALEGKSASEVMDAIVEAVRPVDGTQDAEASRTSIHNALSDLLVQFPDADLLLLTEEQRVFTVERYICEDVFHRFQLDVGTTIQDKAPDMRTALSRLKEVRGFMRETVASAFRQLGGQGQTITSRNVNQIVQRVLTTTFQIFDSYMQ